MTQENQLSNLKPVHSGKVRNFYDVGDSFVVVTSDKISAFDVVMEKSIPNKGKILNQMSAFWFDFTKDIIPNHMISIDPADMPEKFQAKEFDGKCMLVKKLQMLPIECIVRGHITGSGWKSYLENGSVCGVKLKNGLQESEKLIHPIYTPTTKATSGHDKPISFEETIQLLLDFLPTVPAFKDFSARKFKIVAYHLAAEIRDKSIELYSTCSEYAQEKGIIIADTKFEFGIDSEGNLVLADELLTPDSSRFWPVLDYEIGRPQKSLDKQYLRDYLNSTDWDKTAPAPCLPEKIVWLTSERYLQVCQQLTGKTFSIC